MLTILAVVENLSLFNLVRYQQNSYQIKDHTIIEVSGVDRHRFFNGQLTNDIDLLNLKESQLTVRLNRQGRIQSFLQYTKYDENKDYIIILSELAEDFLEEINRFIIMDEVELTQTGLSLCAHFNSNKENQLTGFFVGEKVSFSFSREESTLSSDEIRSLEILNGSPVWNENVKKDQLLNETILNDTGVSYAKGCFLGQETVAKIENNRGAAFFPVLLKGSDDLDDSELLIEGAKCGSVISSVSLEGRSFYQVLLKRDFRVEGIELEISGNTYEVSYLPLNKDHSLKEKAETIYHHAVDIFNDDKEIEAEELFRLAIEFDPSFADAYESLGVLLGRNEKFEEAIDLMDKLLEVNEKSVLAHTNKSLFLMRLGKIEEAEAEKSLATVKTFAMYGEEAKTKKVLEEQVAKERAELDRRKGMFLQVIEMDAEDTIANNGMGEILFKEGQFEESIKYLQRVLEIDSKYSVAYLTLGKSLEGFGKKEEAISNYKVGIEVASKKGDLMPANEMQSRLAKLLTL